MVFLHLIVANWSGDEVARLEVRPSDTVIVGMRQIEEQLGVSVAHQMLVCGEDWLEAGQVWSSYSSVRDWSTIQLTTVGQTFDAASDREALMVIFESCGGDGWTKKLNWGSAEPLSEWEGVSVDVEGRVNVLHVTENRLRGLIPPEIGNLTALDYLSLNGNFLTGCVPSELSRLTVLRILKIGGCKPYQLSGVIPPCICHLKALESLCLPSNQLSGPIPPEICQMTGLRSLCLSSNQLTGPIPQQIGQITNLRVLGLGRNQLTGVIPPEIGQLSNLTDVSLQGNLLKGGIPRELCQLTGIVTMNLSFNQLTGHIPFELGELTKLLYLDVRNNHITGPYDRSIKLRIL